MKKVFSVSLCILILLQSLALGTFVTSAATTPVTFKDSFDYGSFGGESIYDSSETWVVEFDNQNSSDVFGYHNSTPPQVSNGVLKFTAGDGVRLNWQKLEGFGSFDATKTYTIAFDVKVTDFGDDVPLSCGDVWNRELYFAPAGYYNQIEFRSANYPGQTGIRAGDKTQELTTGGWGNNTEEYAVNTVYSCTVEWKPGDKTFISTVKRGNTVISKGSRTNDLYASLNKYTEAFVWRCEDGSIEVDNLSLSDGTNTYTEDFNYTADTMTYSGVWGLENVQKTDAVKPTLDNGVLKLGEKSSVRFNWTKVNGVGKYDETKIYTFEFDTKLTDEGDGSVWSADNNIYYTRGLYVGFGGWFTFVELPTKDDLVKIGDSTDPCTAEKYVNKDLHVSLTWEGKMISATITDADGNVLIQGARTSDNFVDMSVERASMTYLVLRCEDGAVEVDNFEFRAESIDKVNTTALNITSGKQAIYECDVTYTGSGKTAVKLGNSLVFSIGADGLKVCSRSIQGTYGAGNYKVKVYINPEQEMLSAEVVMPDGGVVRRGVYNLFGGTSVDVYSNNASDVKNIKVSYADITVNEYEITDTEPAATGFGENVYNLITSFDDACTTRNFAWTAKAAFIGNGKMAVKYRAQGATDWTVVVAVREREAIAVADEDYFKCDISGLGANTVYEYKIGKKDSTDEANDWSKTYTFKTSAESVDEFSFIAVGDTQGITWGGDTVDQKGFKYAKAAFEEAFAEVPDPAFILHAGDVVEWGGNKNMWNWYFKALGEYGASTPHFATMGNHDTWRNSNENLYFDYHFNHPNNGGAAALDGTIAGNVTENYLSYVIDNVDETIYSYDYGDAHFIVLNSGSYGSQDEYILKAQREWLIKDLESNKCAKWTVILVHEPVYHRNGGSESRPWLYDVIEGYGVDLVIQGHSHLVTRSYPMKNGQIVTKANPDVIPQGTGTVYTTIGSTALNHDGLGDASNIEEMLNVTIPELTQPAYTTVKVDGEKLVVTTKQVNGLVLDQFTITADSERAEHLGETKTENQRSASCGEDGYTGDVVCTGCGEILTKGASIPATGEHTLGDWTVTKEATADEKGEKKRVCTGCDYFETEEIAMLTSSEDTSTDPDGEQKSGCGASVAATATAMLAVLGVAAIAIRKKEH